MPSPCPAAPPLLWGRAVLLLLLLSVATAPAAAAPPAARNFTLGPFGVAWDGSGGLRVVWQAGTVLDLARGWLSAAVGHDVLRHVANGNLQIEAHDTDACTDADVSEVWLDAAHGTLHLAGRLQSAATASRCGQVRFEVRLWSVGGEPATAAMLGLSTLLRPADGVQHDRTVLTVGAPAEERFFGMGAQYSCWDCRGHRVPILSREQGIGRGLEPLTLVMNELGGGAGGDAYTTYTAVPYFVTSRGRALYVAGTDYAVFDLRPRDRVALMVRSLAVVAVLLVGDDPGSVVGAYARTVAGPMGPLPPAFAAAVVGLQGGARLVTERLELLAAHGVNMSAVWIQDWVGQRNETVAGRAQQRLWWNWEPDERLYGDFAAFVAELRRRFAVHVLTYFNPFLVDVSAKPYSTRNLFREARALGYLVRNASGGTYMISGGPDFAAGQIDLTLPAACDWYAAVIRNNTLRVGVSGWMADFGEYLPWDSVLASGRPAASVHNDYPRLWAKLNRRVADEAGGTVAFFSRSAAAGSPGLASLFWLGDQLPSWDAHDGLASALIAMLQAGVSGLTLQHSDTGGYTTIDAFGLRYVRTAELLMRWTEMSAFTAVLRTHEGSVPHLNAQAYSPEVVDHFAAYSQAFASMSAYRAALAAQARAEGLPLARPLWLHYPRDEAAWLRADHFLLGADVLVAPVLTPGATSVRAYLPGSTRWRHLWTGTVTAAPSDRHGTLVQTAAPLGCAAVWLRLTPNNTVPTLLQPLVAWAAHRRAHLRCV